eukprot:4525085-Heterocapsa_arctica.AAC.1
MPRLAPSKLSAEMVHTFCLNCGGICNMVLEVRRRTRSRKPSGKTGASGNEACASGTGAGTASS